MENNYFIKQLGFDRLNEKLPEEIADKIKGVSGVHYSGDLPAVFFKEVENFELPVLNEIAELQKQIWNNSSVVFLYVVSLAEIRIYNCNDKPVYAKDKYELEQDLNEKLVENCFVDDKEKLKQIHYVFSAVGIDCGTVWTSEAEYSKKIKLQTKVDSFLVNSLINLAKKLSDEIKNDEVIHSLIMRSIFIMYLQDRGAIPQSIWDIVGEYDFLKILDDHVKTYKLFEIISKNFNGNAFPIHENESDIVSTTHLKYLKHCLTDGDINLSQAKFIEWRLFNFSLIRIEMLSEIYENFLGEFNPTGKKNAGAYYTPPSLVELVLRNVLPESEIEYKKKILDPACGSGIFLAMAYKRLVNRWKKATKKEPDFAVLSNLLTDNIFGVELDKKSIKVAAFSLYLSMLDFLDPRDVWLEEDKQFPHLIYDEESANLDDKKGKNLFRTDTIEPEGKFENIAYDLIVGNPPFGTSELQKNIKDYCNRYKFSQQFVIPFIHKSASLAPRGQIALLFNTKILTNTQSTAENFRNWLFEKNYVSKIYNLSILRKAAKDFGGQLFKSATVPVSIIFFQKEQPELPKKTIEYWAPVTYIKNHVTEGVIIDSIDIKYLPREICRQPESKIWKIAQWGTLGNYYLIEKQLKRNRNLALFTQENGIKNGVGFQFLSEDKTIPKADETLENLPVIEADAMERLYSDESNFTTINNALFNARKKTIDFYLSLYKVNSYDDLPKIDKFRRLGKLGAYQAPHLLLKKGLTQTDKICASYLDVKCCFKDGVYGFYSEKKDSKILMYLCAVFNSRYAHYFLFLTLSSYGIEREQIFQEEYLGLPFYSPTDEDYFIIARLFDEIKQKRILNDNFSKLDIENKINEHFFKKYELSEKEEILVNDIVNYSINLFHDGQNSIALKPIARKKPETMSYAEMICNEINDFLKIGDFKVNARVYNVSPNTPLCLVVLDIIGKTKVRPPQLIDADSDFQKELKKVEEYTWSEYAQNIYVRKQVRFSTDDSIFIAKPNQKRLWTRSQAIDDANTIINELSASEYGD